MAGGDIKDFDPACWNEVAKATGRPCGHGNIDFCPLCDTPETTIMECGHPLSELALVTDEGTDHCMVCKREANEGPKLDFDKVLWCNIHEAAPNPMFTEDQRRLVRFLRYDKSVPCAECGKRKKAHWSMLCTFLAKSMGTSFFLEASGKVHMPLSPVCQDHLLAPAEWTPPPKESKKKTFRNRLGEPQVEA